MRERVDFCILLRMQAMMPGSRANWSDAMGGHFVEEIQQTTTRLAFAA